MHLVFRCIICGEVFIGTDKPTNCPFCGAPNKFLVRGKAYRAPEEPIKELSVETREMLQKTLDLEVHATRFYLAASKGSSDPFVQSMFKGLSKTEREHASVAAKALGVPKPDSLNDPEGDKGSDGKNIMEADRLEKNATALYRKFMEESVEPRAKQIFQALMEVEASHIELVNQ
ncbi:MAG: ferritin-like domain-containing protein [Candidatus Aenigmarchaeota archaeon]|nr:ferritin-like domain-containing protein [Candidatus Aenigmarchaeota archaeon]